jgi:hypothetical protein
MELWKINYRVRSSPHNFMEQGPRWEASSRSASQEIP